MQILKEKKHKTAYDRIEHNMGSHSLDGLKVKRVENLREKAIDFANEIALLAPVSREQSLALTDVESALMWAVAAVARAESADD